MTIQRRLRVSVLSLVSALAFASAAGASTVTLEPGTDRMGSDYKGFALDANDPQLCRQACASDGACKSFTFVKPGIKGPQAMCFLKNATPAATANDCCSSGQKVMETLVRIATPTQPTLAYVPGVAMAGAGSQPPALRTLVKGSGAAPKMPAVKIPADLPAQKLMDLAGGTDGSVFAKLAPNHMLEPGRGFMYFIGPHGVWGGSGGPADPNQAEFGANSDDNVSELHLRLMPSGPALLMVDCKVQAYHDTAVYLVSELLGPEQTFKQSQLVNGHLLFLVNSVGASFVTITSDESWTLYGCDIRKL